MKVIDDSLILYSLYSTNWIPSYSKDFEKKSEELDYCSQMYLKNNEIKFFK